MQATEEVAESAVPTPLVPTSGHDGPRGHLVGHDDPFYMSFVQTFATARHKSLKI
jgi:hypothetical protein